jgi:hypothetical protein
MGKLIALLGSSHAWELARCRVRRRLQFEDLVWCGVGTGLWLMCCKFWTSADRPHRRCHFGAQERWRGLIGFARNTGSGPTGWTRKRVPRSGTTMEPRFDGMRYLLPCKSTATTQASSNPLSHLWIPAPLPLQAHRQKISLVCDHGYEFKTLSARPIQDLFFLCVGSCIFYLSICLELRFVNIDSALRIE